MKSTHVLSSTTPLAAYQAAGNCNTELAGEYPLYVVTRWISNSASVPDEYFERAAKSGAESGAVVV